MANANIGTCPCPMCNGPADVRKQGKGAQLLYLNCERCGHVTPRLRGGQDWILEHATMHGPDGKPPAPAAPPRIEPPAPPPEPEPTATPPPPVTKKRAPIFPTLLG